MRISLHCNGCSHRWEIADEPRHIFALKCPQCATRAPSRAAEDFSTALEDVLMQLWQLGEKFQITVSLGTESLPERFIPPEDPHTPGWDD